MKREMTVTYAPGYVRKPMIRIANSFLLEAGFDIGDKFSVDYKSEVIVIKLKKQHHEDKL